MIAQVIASLLRWCVKKLAGVVLIAALMLAVLALSLFLRDETSAAEHHAEKLKALHARRAELARATGEIDQRAIHQRHGLQVFETRARLAKERIDALREQQSTWQRWFGDREKQKALDTEIERLTRSAADAGKNADDLRRRRGQVKWEREGVEIELAQINTAIERAEAAPNPALHYLGRAWEEGRLFVSIGVPVYLLATAIWQGRGKSVRAAQRATS